LKGMEKKKAKIIPDCLTVFELCDRFGWTPEQVYEMDNKTVEEFIIIMNAQAEHQESGNKEQKRKEVAQKFGTGGR
jgi:hypothetical protein